MVTGGVHQKPKQKNEAEGESVLYYEGVLWRKERKGTLGGDATKEGKTRERGGAGASKQKEE